MEKRLFEGKKFKHAFAVGDGCNMAAALSRTGLRENSGPFDWVICEIEDVMKLVENHFEDYLNPEYLKLDPIPFNAGQRRNTKYDSLIFVHDFDPNEDAPSTEEQIGEIQAKYQRRIDYFYACIKEPTVFFHFEYNSRIDYWKENYWKIRDFFKRYNPENELVVICYGDPQTDLQLDFPFYLTNADKDDHFLGYYIESNPELSRFMHDPELIPYEKRMKNLRFFIDKQLNSNREISMNEMRIARDRLKADQDIWKAWVRFQQSGSSFADKLTADGIKKVGVFGYNSFFEVAVDFMRENGIECDFVMSWYLRGKQEEYGVPVYDPHDHFHDNETEEERKAREERMEQMTEEERDREWAKHFATVPKFKEVDALIGIDVEDQHWLEQSRPYLPCKLYSLGELVGYQK